MLTFEKGGYTREELFILYDALADACSSMRCAETGCDRCPNCKPCADISICRAYVWSVIIDLQN